MAPHVKRKARGSKRRQRLHATREVTDQVLARLQVRYERRIKQARKQACAFDNSHINTVDLLRDDRRQSLLREEGRSRL